jgi:sulfur relay (sulfurtransferase) DsrF/TusC family protein
VTAIYKQQTENSQVRDYIDKIQYTNPIYENISLYVDRKSTKREKIIKQAIYVKIKIIFTLLC